MSELATLGRVGAASATPNAKAALPPFSPLPAESWRGRRVHVLGLGRHGGAVGAVRFLAAAGARLTVSDQADERFLAVALDQLAGVPVERLRLGGHSFDDLAGVELLVANPAVSPRHPVLQAAAAAGIEIGTEVDLLLRHCPARVIGITGTLGKSTTSAMIAHLLAAVGQRAWLGGNFGGSLLAQLDAITPADWVVLELSSFQLARLSQRGRSIDVSVVTNFHPHHLDWHGNVDAYRAAKQRLLARQSTRGWAVLNVADAALAAWKPLVRGGLVRPPSDEAVPPLLVPGCHNRRNAACALAAASAVLAIDSGGEPLAKRLIDELSPPLAAFPGLPHRIELVDTFAGRRFYNDSKATTPAAAMAALGAIDGPIWLIAGGKEAGQDFSPLAEQVVRRVHGVALVGQTKERLAAELARAGASEPAATLAHAAEAAGSAGSAAVTRSASIAASAPLAPPQRAAVRRTAAPGMCGSVRLKMAESLGEAVCWCWQASRAGDAIVLAPGCASHDSFADYTQRGGAFVAEIEAIRQEIC